METPYSRLFGVVAAVALGCAVVAAFAYAEYRRLDSIGWIPHHEETDINYENEIYGQNDRQAAEKWSVGESKDCLSYPFFQVTSQHRNEPTTRTTINPLDCNLSCDVIRDGPDSGPPSLHASVTFLGRTEQPEYDWIIWHCTRNVASFTCKQTKNSPPFLRGTDRATGSRVKSLDGGKTWQWE